jgi:hypothetical protein
MQNASFVWFGLGIAASWWCVSLFAVFSKGLCIFVQGIFLGTIFILMAKGIADRDELVGNLIKRINYLEQPNRSLEETLAQSPEAEKPTIH